MTINSFLSSALSKGVYYIVNYVIESIFFQILIHIRITDKRTHFALIQTEVCYLIYIIVVIYVSI